MFDNDVQPTKILFIDSDEAAFQIRQCVAQALSDLPPVELYHARDATEALAIMEKLQPDVVVLDEEEQGEKELFLDSLSINHPPIVMQVDEAEQAATKPQQEVTYVVRNESLEGIHETLMVAASLGVQFTGERALKVVH